MAFENVVNEIQCISNIKSQNNKNCLNCSMEGNTSRKGELDEPGLQEKEEENTQPVTGEKRSASVQETIQPEKKPKTLHPDENIQSKKQRKRYEHVTSFNATLASG